MDQRQKTALLAIIVVGVMLLLAQVLRLLPPETGLITYAMIALLALLVTIVKGVFDKQQEK